jgi:hypothetical protein
MFIDGVSCGAYVMFAMTLLTFGTFSISSPNFTPDMIQPFRCYVFNCIMQEEFHVLAYACPVCLHWYTSKEGGPEMVACDICGIWTHLACTPYKSLCEANRSYFVCKNCNEA